MTPAERLAHQKAVVLAEIEAKKKRLAHLEAQEKERARKVRRGRHLAVGKLADQAGLLAWDDATLARLFQVLARLADAPSPEAVLESLLEEPAAL